MNKLKTIILVIFSLAVLQCAEDGLSAKIDFALLPEKPIVFLDGISIPQSGDKPNIDIDANWFKAAFTVTNSSTETFVLQNVKFTYFNSGGADLGTSVVDPSEWDFDYDGDGTIDVDIGKTYFKEIAPSTSYTVPVSWYLNGITQLPKKATVYKVKVEPIGWFGTLTEQNNRFSRAFYFTTQ